MQTNSGLVFDLLKVLAWVIFIGSCIEAGTVVTTNVIYETDLSKLFSNNPKYYYFMLSLAIFVSSMKAFLFYMIINLTEKLNLDNPFHIDVYTILRKISGITLSIGIMGIITRQYVNYLKHRDTNLDNIDQFWTDASAFLVMAGVVFVIAKIFERGLAIQSENDLTI